MPLVGSLTMNTALEYSTRVVQEGDRRCKKSTLNDLAHLTPLRIPLMNPVHVCSPVFKGGWFTLTPLLNYSLRKVKAVRCVSTVTQVVCTHINY
jgi:hypothetical protein